MTAAGRVWMGVLNAVFPWTCLSCRMLSFQSVCQSCVAQFAFAHGKCVVCSRPSPAGLTHPPCRSPLGLEGSLAAFAYKENGLDKIIIAGKYNFLPTVFKILGRELAVWMNRNAFTGRFHTAVIVPVPLANKRKRWRGFNQSHILADTVAKAIGLKVEHLLLRTASAETQKDLSQKARLENVRGVFALAGKKSPWYAFLFKGYKPKTFDLAGKVVLLVDDVVTTGATLREAGKVLKRNGAREVWGLTVAGD